MSDDNGDDEDGGKLGKGIHARISKFTQPVQAPLGSLRHLPKFHERGFSLWLWRSLTVITIVLIVHDVEHVQK